MELCQLIEDILQIKTVDHEFKKKKRKKKKKLRKNEQIK